MTTPTAIRTAWQLATTSDETRVRLLVHEPPCAARGWLVWAHGGSWQFGSAAQWASVTSQIAKSSGWGVVSVDYRLAPEHRFPAQVADILAALDYAETRAEDLPVAVGGDSAGGTIAFATAIARRDLGGPVPAQILAYPPLDPSCASPSYSVDPGAFPDPRGLRDAWRRWLGTSSHSDSTNMFTQPNLEALAPVSLLVGGDDPVRDGVIAYANRLKAEQVPVRLSELPGVGHADLLTPQSRILAALVRELTVLSPEASCNSKREGIPS